MEVTNQIAKMMKKVCLCPNSGVAKVLGACGCKKRLFHPLKQKPLCFKIIHKNCFKIKHCSLFVLLWCLLQSKYVIVATVIRDVVSNNVKV